MDKIRLTCPSVLLLRCRHQTVSHRTCLEYGVKVHRQRATKCIILHSCFNLDTSVRQFASRRRVVPSLPCQHCSHLCPTFHPTVLAARQPATWMAAEKRQGSMGLPCGQPTMAREKGSLSEEGLAGAMGGPGRVSLPENANKQDDFILP